MEGGAAARASAPRRQYRRHRGGPSAAVPIPALRDGTFLVAVAGLTSRRSTSHRVVRAARARSTLPGRPERALREEQLEGGVACHTYLDGKKKLAVCRR